MKAITIKQPWASLIVHGIKDIENRSWPCPKKYLGERVLIHAGADKCGGWFLNNDQSISLIRSKSVLCRTLFDDLPFGSIIGSVEIVDCVRNHPSVWAEKGVYNWLLANPALFKNPIPAKGRLSFWEYDNLSEDARNVVDDVIKKLKSNE